MQSWLSGSGQKSQNQTKSSSMFPSIFHFGRNNNHNPPSKLSKLSNSDTTIRNSFGLAPNQRSNFNDRSGNDGEFDRADDMAPNVPVPMSRNPVETVRFAENVNAFKGTRDLNSNRCRSSNTNGENNTARHRREGRGTRDNDRETEKERERSRSRERDVHRKKATQQRQKQWIRNTDARIRALVKEVKRLRSEMQNVKQRMDENEKKNNVFVIAPNTFSAPETGTRRAIPYYQYGPNGCDQMEHVQTMMNPFICALNEALNRNQDSQQRSPVNINFISLNQTRNKIATHNQTVKVDTNAPTSPTYDENHNRNCNQDTNQTSSSRFQWN